VGATAAFVALLGGRLAANLYLLPSSRAVVRRTGPCDTNGAQELESSETRDGYDD